MRKIYILLLAAAAFSGCTKDTTAYQALIGFDVAGVTTKGDVPTKGTVVTTENIPTTYGEFITDAWVCDDSKSDAEAHSQNQHQIDKMSVTYNSGTGKWNLATDTYWLNNVNECFWSWAPVTVETRTINEPAAHDVNGELTFSYSMPAANGTSDAENQKDLLFAYNYQMLADGATEGLVSIKFFHALSWVRFLIDKKDGTFDTDLEISSIKLNNIYSTGNGTFKPTQILNKKFEWTNNNVNKANFGQTFSVASDFAEETTNSGKFYSSTDKAFMVIPQTLASDASVTITFLRKDDDSNWKTIERTAVLPTDTWVAGYYYTYKINAKNLDNPLGFTVEYVDWEDGGTGEI